MPRKTDAREKAVKTTERLLQRQGYAATGLGEVIEESGSPKGSFYFHFPGGKEQLASEAIDHAGHRVLAVFESLRDSSTSPADFLERFCQLEAKQLKDSGFERGCPVATVALEMANRSEPIRTAAATAFSAWTDLLADYFRAEGVAEPAEMASWVLATVEGALILARAWRDTAVIIDTGARLAEALGGARPTAPKTRRSLPRPRRNR